MKSSRELLNNEKTLNEVAAILAMGIMRLRNKSKHNQNSGELSLDFIANRSMCVTVTKTEKHHE